MDDLAKAHEVFDELDRAENLAMEQARHERST
jgi:hypothetical protein